MATIYPTFVDRVNAEAKDIQFWRVVLTAVAGLLYGIGWLVGKVFVVIWLVLTWTAAALKVGFQDARRKPDPKRRSG